MRVVLDTNVLISAFISRKSLPFQAIRFWVDGNYELITSLWQIEEFRRTSRKPKLKGRINTSDMGTFINALRGNATVVDSLPTINLSPDPDDDFILATAIAGKAQYIVSGDKDDLLNLKKVEGIRILTVREFLSQFN